MIDCEIDRPRLVPLARYTSPDGAKVKKLDKSYRTNGLEAMIGIDEFSTSDNMIYQDLRIIFMVI